MDQSVRDLPTGAWPAGLTRVPYWVYRDPEVARDEQARVFEGPAWHYLCLEIDVPEPGDYRTTMMGAMPVVVARAEDGEIVAFRKPLRASRGADLPRRWRQGEGFPLRLSRLALRPARQPEVGRVPSRRERQRRHARRLPRWQRTARANSASPWKAVWCSARWPTMRRAFEDFIGPEVHGPVPPRAAQKA